MFSSSAPRESLLLVLCHLTSPTNSIRFAADIDEIPSLIVGNGAR